MISTNSISGNIKFLTDCLSVKLQKSVARLLLLSLLLVGLFYWWWALLLLIFGKQAYLLRLTTASVYSYLSLHDTQQTFHRDAMLGNTISQMGVFNRRWA